MRPVVGVVAASELGERSGGTNRSVVRPEVVVDYKTLVKDQARVVDGL